MPFLRKAQAPAASSSSSTRGARRATGAELAPGPAARHRRRPGDGRRPPARRRGPARRGVAGRHAVGWPRSARAAGRVPARGPSPPHGDSPAQMRRTRPAVRHRPAGPDQDRRRHQPQPQRRAERPGRPAPCRRITGQYGTRGGGLAYSTSGYVQLGQGGGPQAGRVPARRAEPST